MSFTRDDKGAAANFEVAFPLLLRCEGGAVLRFSADRDAPLVFGPGLYFICGDNGSGKTSFCNMLALIAGRVGPGTDPRTGGIRFNGEAYNGKGFDGYRAAEIREKSFCIFPQKAFFLPVSSRDNYAILNGRDPSRAAAFSDTQIPDLLSGGQQQKILMDIVLDEHKPVWFLDEPLANLDARRRAYFWQTLYQACRDVPRILFYIDHWMAPVIPGHPRFDHSVTLGVELENAPAARDGNGETKYIDIYRNPDPASFFLDQAQRPAA